MKKKACHRSRGATPAPERIVFQTEESLARMKLLFLKFSEKMRKVELSLDQSLLDQNCHEIDPRSAAEREL